MATVTVTTHTTTTTAGGGEWSNGLFGCFSNMGLCIITFFVPCYTAGKNAERTGDSCILFGLAYLLPPVNVITHFITRRKVRQRFGIEGSDVMDFLLAWCCDCCALIQEAQELDIREPTNVYVQRS